MRKIMIKQNALDCFTDILDEKLFSIKIELAQKEINRGSIVDLVDELKLTWADVYNAADIQVSRSLRNLYGLYIKAKKSGDMGQADLYLDCYLSARNNQGTGSGF